MIDSLNQAEIKDLWPKAPDWAMSLKPRIEGDGRLFFEGEINGAQVYVQPKAWAKMNFRDAANRSDAGAVNYGLQLPQMQAHAGQIETNDPTFGQQILGTQAECRTPAASSSAMPPGLIPALILGASLVVAAVIVLFSRRAQ